jgi:hypothetical protein
MILLVLGGYHISDLCADVFTHLKFGVRRQIIIEEDFIIIEILFFFLLNEGLLLLQIEKLILN